MPYRATYSIDNSERYGDQGFTEDASLFAGLIARKVSEKGSLTPEIEASQV